MENSELRARLREAGDAELIELLTEHGDELDPGAACLALQNPYCGREAVELLLERRHLLSAQEVCLAIVAHPATPETRALNLLPHLFWRDLVRLGAGIKTRPRIRRAADLRLGEKIPRLSVGERMAIARRAGPGALTKLRHDTHPRVISAMLENPRLTEGLLAPLLSSETADPKALEAVADDRRWGLRYIVRAMLAKNPRTPVTTALGLLSSLKKSDLKAVASDWRIAAAVRRRANLLWGGESGPRGRSGLTAD